MDQGRDLMARLRGADSVTSSNTQRQILNMSDPPTGLLARTTRPSVEVTSSIFHPPAEIPGGIFPEIFSGNNSESKEPDAAPAIFKSTHTRRASTAGVRGESATEDATSRPAKDERRNKLGYDRNSGACGHCRRRKIRCIAAPNDIRNRCSNCIRLKKECNFQSQDQQSSSDRGRPILQIQTPQRARSPTLSQSPDSFLNSLHPPPPQEQAWSLSGNENEGISPARSIEKLSSTECQILPLSPQEAATSFFRQNTLSSTPAPTISRGMSYSQSPAPPIPTHPAAMHSSRQTDSHRAIHVDPGLQSNHMQTSKQANSGRSLLEIIEDVILGDLDGSSVAVDPTTPTEVIDAEHWPGYSSPLSNDTEPPILSRLEGKKIRTHVAPTIKSPRGPACEASFLLHWDIREFLTRQFNGFKDAPLSSIITISGTYLNAQAATVEDYLVENWPETSNMLLTVLQSAIHDGQSEFQEDGITLKITIDKTLTCFSRCPRKEFVQIAQQLAWLGSALQHSPTNSLALSTVLIRPRLGGRHVFDFTFYFPTSKKNTQSCWHGLFSNAVIAEGFPIPNRTQELGLEIPSQMILALSGIRHAVLFEGGILLKGYSCALIPVMGYQSSTQWHYFETDTANRLSYPVIAAQFPKRARVQDVNFEAFQKTRTFVGWWGQTETHLGTHTADYRNLDYSCAEYIRGGVKLDGASFEFQNMITGKVNFSLGAREGKLHVERKGPYQSIVRCASRTPVLLYDYDDKRAWLVPSSAVILHIVRTRHSQEPYANGLEAMEFSHTNLRNRDNHSFSEDILLENASLKLFCAEDSQNQNYLLRDAVRDIWSRLDAILDMDVTKEKEPEQGIRISMKTRLRGWEFMAIVEDMSPLRQKEANIQRCSGGWTRLASDVDAVVLFASGFGDVIKPSEGACSLGLCKRWARVPAGNDYMATSIPILLQLFDRAGCRLTKKFLTPSHLRWNRGQILWESCETMSYQCNCDRLQGLVQKSGGSFSEIREPGLLEQDGAVIFGQSTQSLSLPKSAPKKHRLYSQTNLGFLLQGPEGSLASDSYDHVLLGQGATMESELVGSGPISACMPVQEAVATGVEEDNGGIQRRNHLPKRSRHGEEPHLPAEMLSIVPKRDLKQPSGSETPVETHSTLTVLDRAAPLIGTATNIVIAPKRSPKLRLRRKGNIKQQDHKG